MRKLTVGIVTYNNRDEIDQVLKSILNSNGVSPTDVYICDNNSSDGTSEYIEEVYPNIHLIKNTINVGFGKAHNQIIKQINSKYHLILNPDIKFKNHIIEELIEIMDNNSDYVLCSPKIYGTDGNIQFLPKQKPKLKYILSGKLETKSKYFKKIRDEYTMKDYNFTKATEINFCTGCFMFTRTSVLKMIGGFDERYFLHFEDADLTLMMKKYGKTVYIPHVSVTHEWHRDNIKNSKIQKIAIKSMFKFLWKWSFINV